MKPSNSDEGQAIIDFLYWGKPNHAWPRDDYSINTAFEVGGTYETWGWEVRKRSTGEVVGTGRFPSEAIKEAIRNEDR